METILRHNAPDAVIRRPNHLTDEQWDWLVTETVLAVYKSRQPTSFLLELVKILMHYKDEPAYAYILKMLNVNVDRELDLQNWEYIASRFFRHFCPEDFRNAINHSGLRVATLECKNKEFFWLATLDLTVACESKIFGLVDAKIGDKITVKITGLSNIDSVTLTNGDISFQYYEKGMSKSFSDTLYMLRRAVIQNKKEAKQNEI